MGIQQIQQSIPSRSQKLIEQCISDYEVKPFAPLEFSALAKEIKRPSASLDSLKAIVHRDPVMCWLLIQAGYQATIKRTTHPFAADHAMTIIGIGGLDSLLKKVKNTKPSKRYSKEVLFSLSSSILAAHIAREIGELTNKMPHLYWTALFLQLPETILWHLHPKSMWRCQYRQLTLPKKMDLFEESKLGFNLYEWRLAVADYFHMDEQIKFIYERRIPNTPRELYEYMINGLSDYTPTMKAWHRQDAFIALMSNRLAQSINLPWNGQSRYRLIEILKQSTGIDTKRLNKAIFSAVEQTSQLLKYSHLISPAVTLLLQPSNRKFPEWLVKPTKSAKAQSKRKALQKKLQHKRSSISAKAESYTNDISSLIKKLTSHSNQFSSSTELVHSGLQSIITDLKFSRVSFLGIDYNNKTAKTRIALNAEGASKIRPDFDFKLPTPLTQFVDKQTFSVISKEKHKMLWTKLPQAIQREQVERFIFCSLQPGNRVRAIIYVDATDPKCFEAKRLTKVKMLLQAINKGLIHRNQAKQ